MERVRIDDPEFNFVMGVVQKMRKKQEVEQEQQKR